MVAQKPESSNVPLMYGGILPQEEMLEIGKKPCTEVFLKHGSRGLFYVQHRRLEFEIERLNLELAAVSHLPFEPSPG